MTMKTRFERTLRDVPDAAITSSWSVASNSKERIIRVCNQSGKAGLSGR